MKKAFILLSIALIWSACATASLFNGSDLKDWHAYGTEKWYAEDGTLVAESGPDAQYGYLCTDMAYDDFDITLEFKLEANGNSGMFIRSTVSGTKVSGWQVEIAPDKDKTGGVYALDASAASARDTRSRISASVNGLLTTPTITPSSSAARSRCSA